MCSSRNRVDFTFRILLRDRLNQEPPYIYTTGLHARKRCWFSRKKKHCCREIRQSLNCERNHPCSPSLVIGLSFVIDLTNTLSPEGLFWIPTAIRSYFAPKNNSSSLGHVPVIRKM